VKRNPLLANLSRFGVLISPPKQLRSLKPRSSATMTRKLGLLDASLALLEDCELVMFVCCEKTVPSGCSEIVQVKLFSTA